MEKVEESGVGHTSELARIIPYGTDLSVFHPAAKSAVRDRLGVPQDSKILIFTANGIRRNIFKDYQTMRSAIMKVAQRRQQDPLLFIALGDDAPPEHIGAAEVRFVPYQKDPAVVATYYQAADIYLHAARADTFPNTVLEALACATPVIATAVGGIPEQVKGLRGLGGNSSIAHLNRYEIEDATGLLVQARDSEMMAIMIEKLLNDEFLRRQLSENASRDAHNRFDVRREVNDYLDWYKALLRSTRKTYHAGSVNQEGLST
jgi:glycosyltransferase involved in cell wall biosynthesis